MPERPSGRDALEAKGIDKAYGPKQVLSGVNVNVRRGEKVAIIGANGLGKSALLRILAGRVEKSAGEVKWGHEVRLGYFPQDHHELFDNPKQTVLDYLWQFCPREGTSKVRGELGAVLFTATTSTRRSRLCPVVKRPDSSWPSSPSRSEHVAADDPRTISTSSRSRRSRSRERVRGHGAVRLAQSLVRVRARDACAGGEAQGSHRLTGTYEAYLARCGDDHLDQSAVLLKKKAERRRSRHRNRSVRVSRACGGGLPK